MKAKLKSELLKNIFYSGFFGPPEWLVLDEIKFGLENKILLLEKVNLVFNRINFNHAIEQIKTTDGIGGAQGKGHMTLKRFAVELMEQGHLVPKTERYFLGAHPDVISKDGAWIIECGTTNPSVVFLYLSSKKVDQVSILPYLFAEENKFTLYTFVRGQKFDNWQKNKHKDLRELFFRLKG